MKKIKIDTSKLTPAPIDGKNVTSDWLVEYLFDDQDFMFNKNEHLGFIGGYPTYMEYHDNIVVLRFVRVHSSENEICAWGNTIVARITENDYEPVCDPSKEVVLYYFDDQIEGSYMHHIITFKLYGRDVMIEFHWDVPDDED